MYKNQEDEIEDHDDKFEQAALEFQTQFRGMLNKYQHLLMQESMVSL